MSEPSCTSGTDHSSSYRNGHWRCNRCGYHGCHEGDCEPGRPVGWGLWPAAFPDDLQYVAE